MMPKKGFLTPLNDWLKRDKFYGMVKEKFQGEVANRYFNQDAIMKLLDDHKAGKAHNMKKIWSIYCFTGMKSTSLKQKIQQRQIHLLVVQTACVANRPRLKEVYTSAKPGC